MDGTAWMYQGTLAKGDLQIEIQDICQNCAATLYRWQTTTQSFFTHPSQGASQVMAEPYGAF